MEGDEAVAEGPVLHGFVEDHILLEQHHGDVLKEAQPLQDLLHGLGLGLLGHGADPHHYLPLRGLQGHREEGWGVSLSATTEPTKGPEGGICHFWEHT